MTFFGIDTDKVSKIMPSISGFGYTSNRRRDWTVIVTTAVIFLVLLSVFSVSIFFQVRSGNFADKPTRSATGVMPTTLDREKLNQTVADIQEQKKNFSDYTDSDESIPNPAQ